MLVRKPGEIHAAFEKAFRSGDLDGLVDLYEADAVLVAEPGTPVAGRDAIREVYKAHLAARPSITVETVAAFEKDGLALLHGKWELNGTGPDGSPIHTAGRNSEVVRRQPDGTWLFIIDNPFTPE